MQTPRTAAEMQEAVRLRSPFLSARCNVDARALQVDGARPGCWGNDAAQVSARTMCGLRTALGGCDMGVSTRQAGEMSSATKILGCVSS